MRIINQKIEKVDPEDYSLRSIYKAIEIAGRNCYKSEDKITEQSAERFVGMLINKGHRSPLEFGTMYLKIPNNEFVGTQLEAIYRLPYSKQVLGGKYTYITTNYRAMKDFSGCAFQIFGKYFCRQPEPEHIKRHTFRIITDRAIMAEITRHRTLSFCIESTRYCNYSKDKFGKELTFINQGDIQPFINGLLESIEVEYMQLVKEKSAQEARAVLPCCLKTDIMLCGFETDLMEVVRLRKYGTAPLMKELAYKMEELIKQYDYEI